MGIFLLNDDPNVAPCYACLLNSPLGHCSMGGGGLTCAMTYGFLAGFNAIFLLFKLFSDGPFVFISFGSQLCGAFLGMKLNAMVSAMMPDMAMPLQGGGPGGPFGAGPFGGLGPPGSQPPPGGGGPPEAQPFQAFRGTGMRLGG